jgi:hypothetical protein
MILRIRTSPILTLSRLNTTVLTYKAISSLFKYYKDILVLEVSIGSGINFIAWPLI